MFSDHNVYNKNKENKGIDANKIIYPSVDNTKIFEFIDEVRSSTINNAIVPFKDYSDIEAYLKQQWAGMMFSFLTSRNEENRLIDTMTQLIAMNERIEYMSTQLVKSVGSPEAVILVKLYQKIIGAKSIKSMFDIGLQPNPIDILINKTLAECASKLGRKFIPMENIKYTISSTGEVSKSHFEIISNDYLKLREELLKTVADNGLSIAKLKEYQ